MITLVSAAAASSAWLLVAVTAFAGCAGTEQPPAAAPRSPSLAQKIDALTATFPDAIVQLDPDSSRVARIQHLKAPAAAANAEELARSVLRQPTVAAMLGVSSDLRELCQPESRNDPQLPGYAVVRMQQCVSGARVFGAELVMSVRTTPSPAIDVLTSGLRADLPRSTAPAIDGAKAQAIAAGRVKQADRPSPPPELVVFVPAVFQLTGASRLCWLVHLGGMAIFIDAANGSIAHQYPEAQR